MSEKKPFPSGLQEEMRMRGYRIRTEKIYLIGDLIDFTAATG